MTYSSRSQNIRHMSCLSTYAFLSEGPVAKHRDLSQSGLEVNIRDNTYLISDG